MRAAAQADEKRLERPFFVQPPGYVARKAHRISKSPKIAAALKGDEITKEEPKPSEGDIAKAARLTKLMHEFLDAAEKGERADMKLIGRGLSAYSKNELNRAHRDALRDRQVK